jgi:hypothetical protein
LKIESLRIPPVRKNDSPAKSSTAARPFGPPIKPGPGSVIASALKPGGLKPGLAPGLGKVTRPLALEEKRRSQRVMLRVRANIHVALHGKQSSFEVTTLSVNDHGAIVVVERNLPLGTTLVLEHAGTKECVACKVVRSAREMPDGFHLPIEFDSPAPSFWKIAFPPSDWRPNE